MQRDYQLYVALPILLSDPRTFEHYILGSPSLWYDADMLADLWGFDKQLQSHRFPNLKTRLRVFADEDHASVFPFVLTHGLRAYLKSSK